MEMFNQVQLHGELIKNEKLIDIAQKIIKKLKFCYIINLY